MEVQFDVDLLEALNSFEHQISEFTKYVETLGNVELTKRWLTLGTVWLDWMAQTRAQRLGGASKVSAETLKEAKEIACDPWTWGAHVSAVMAGLYEALTGDIVVRG